MTWTNWRIFAVFAIAVGACPAAAIAHDSGASHRDDAQVAARQQTLVIGRVSQDPVKTLPRLEALSTYLVDRLTHLGITDSGVVVARSNAEMVMLLQTGQVDAVSETVMSAFMYADHAGAELLMREWKRGVSSYHSFLFTRRDSGIDSIDDLRGRVIAFEDRGSTTGFLIPMAMLREHGLEAVELPAPGMAPPPGKVGFLFVGNEINIAAWVTRGMVDAGALNDGDWADVERTPEGLKDQLTVFHQSPAIPRSVLIVRGDMDAALRDSLQQALAGMENDPDGRTGVGHLLRRRPVRPVPRRGLAGPEPGSFPVRNHPGPVRLNDATCSVTVLAGHIGADRACRDQPFGEPAHGLSCHGGGNPRGQSAGNA